MKDRLAYLAGIIDGEGSIGFCGRSPRVSVSMRTGDDQPVVLIGRHLRVKLGHTPQRGASRPQTYVQVYNKEARDFLIAIRPWLLVKTRQADLLIEYVTKFRMRPYQRLELGQADEATQMIQLMHIYNNPTR